MAAFEEDLKRNHGSGRVETTGTISSDFFQFRDFIVSSLAALQPQLAVELDNMEMRTRKKMLLLWSNNIFLLNVSRSRRMRMPSL